MEALETEQARILTKIVCDRGVALERENADLRKRLWALVEAQTRLAEMLAAQLAKDVRLSEALRAQRERDETETGRDETETERRHEYKCTGPGSDTSPGSTTCTVYIRGGGIVRVFEILMRDYPEIPLKDWSVSEVIRAQRGRDKTETGRRPHKPKKEAENDKNG
jgi:hypothetical protein